MRLGLRLGWMVLVTVAGCATRPGRAPAPVGDGAATALALPSLPSPPAPTAVVQSLVYPSTVVWGSHGRTLAVVGQQGCSAAVYDVEAGLVTAQLTACGMTRSRADDGFIVRTPSWGLELWSPGHADARPLPVDRTQPYPVFSPDGGRLATLDEDAIVLLDPETGEQVRRILVAHAGPLRWLGDGEDVAPWSADGAYLAVGGDRQAWIVGIGPDETQTRLDCETRYARFAPRGDFLGVDCLAAGDGGRLWSSREHRVVATLPAFRGWSATGKYVVTPRAADLDVQDAETGAVALRLAGVAAGTLAFSPDDAWVAASVMDVHADHQLVVWDVANGTPVLTRGSLVAPRWSGDSAFLAAQEQAALGRLVVLQSGTWTERWGQPRPYSEAAWAPVGARLAVGSTDLGIDVVDMHTLASRPVGVAETARITRMDPGAEGAVVALLETRASMRTGEACQALRTDGHGVTSIVEAPCAVVQLGVLSPDGAMTTRVTSPTPMAVLMAPRTILSVEELATGEKSFVDSGWSMGNASWSARGHRLLVPGQRAAVYDADTHRIWAVRPRGGSWALDADGKRVAVGMPDGTVQIVTLESREAPLVLPWATEPAVRLALAGDHLAAVGQKGAVTVWDVARQEIVGSWETGLTPSQVLWGGDGAFLAIADAERVSLSRPDGARTVTLTALRTARGTTWVARDEEGLVDGPPEALDAVRWLLPRQHRTGLKAADVERATGKSPVHASLIQGLAQDVER